MKSGYQYHLFKRSCSIVFFIFITLNQTFGQDSIPKNSGFSGFIRPGVGLIWSESNMIAGNKFTQFEIQASLH